MRGFSLLWKILLSTSIAITVLFAVTGWIVQEQFERIAAQTLAEEVQAGFRAYEALWKARAEKLASVSLILSRMPDVRAAFGTGDQATIRDTAGEVWGPLAEEETFFLVTDPRGAVLASLGGAAGVRRDLELVRQASSRFPEQSSGFWLDGQDLYQTVVTPVYVASSHGQALINVLVVGTAVNAPMARKLKESTGGSDFVFASGGKVLATTLAYSAPLKPEESGGGLPPHVDVAGDDYLDFRRELVDMQAKSIGELHILRPFEASRRRLEALRRNIVGFWVMAMLAALGFSYWMAKRILEPVRALDRAAAEMAQGNLETRVDAVGNDELGRLARTFNGMCESISAARAELIRQERISTISRLSTSIVHDLRNPLAAIYGGSEMLVDEELPEAQVKRLAGNIYRASRRVQELLSDLSDVTRGRTQGPESCRLAEVVEAAREVVSNRALEFELGVEAGIELMLERSRMERVFENLFANAAEAGATRLRVAAEQNGENVLVTVEDNGPGVAEGVRGRLFEPFVTAGKKNGIGLGLALSRQTLLDHGGDLWLESGAGGARFRLRLPR